ncbi:VOC family protein [Micromonosporaceae bacterium DT55]|uniref:VOC family protein n=1 Tax=Melissospora conviva TaxID=3388432 RepID=UPI003C17D86B
MVLTVESGTPNWVDLATSDLDGARRFYSGLLGWNCREVPQGDTGTYAIFDKDGSAVAGLGPPATPGQPSTWSVYVSTDDADSAADRVQAAGGDVLVDPFDVTDQGRMAVFADPAGAAFSVWQPKLMKGAELLNAPGSLTWNELTTPDQEGAKEFYELVFGWQPEEEPIEQPDQELIYTSWRLGNRFVAGMMPTFDPNWPDGLPAYWAVFFEVDDVDAAAARCRELGGVVMVPPRELPAGRLAVLNDPQGASFCVITPGSPD